ncbi:MAG: Gluconate dehydratase [Clostridiales bacterium]|jgi:L-alanine-DL-glutamate epimerase-like enolase superfamily enzyme|nr:Gluconate dehydratase [Clostridiales bacterium]
MKITSIDVIQVQSGNSGRGRGTWRPIITRINTDEGISGFGEAGLAYGKGWRAGFGMIQDFAEVLIGLDPMKIEKIWDTLFSKTFWGKGGGTIVNAGISALDIALWDIKGKALGVPVYQLLGGKTNDNLRTYASQLQYNWGEVIDKEALRSPEEYAEVTKRVIKEGYNCIKVDPIVISSDENNSSSWKITGPLSNKILKTVYNRVRAMREAGGDDLDIIVEMHSNTDSTAAIQVGKILEELRIFYYEEPVHPLNSELMLKVHKNVNIPIASGERIYTRFGYIPFLQNGSIQVIQPDLCLCGGITEAKKICDMAYAFDCTVQIHVCGSPISKAAALQLEAVIPNFLIHEHHQRALNPESRGTCLYDYQPINGIYQVPDKPGIGQELVPEIIEKSNKVTVKSKQTYNM